MFKHLFILAVVLMAVLSLSTVVYAEDTREIKLTSEQSMLILELQAAGKIVEADSLNRVFLNQIFLDNAAADSVRTAQQRSENNRTLRKTGVSLVLIFALAAVLVYAIRKSDSNDL